MRAKNSLLWWWSFLLRTGKPDPSMTKTPNKSPFQLKNNLKILLKNCQGHQKQGTEKLSQEQPPKR